MLQSVDDSAARPPWRANIDMGDVRFGLELLEPFLEAVAATGAHVFIKADGDRTLGGRPKIFTVLISSRDGELLARADDSELVRAFDAVVRQFERKMSPGLVQLGPETPMNVSDVVASLDWAAPPPADSNLESVWTALRRISAAESETSVARGVAALEDSVTNGHAGVLYPVAHLGATVMLAVIGRWRTVAREQALVSLLTMLDLEVISGYETYVNDSGARVDVEEVIYRQIQEATPLLRSVIDERPTWRSDRKLALQLVERAATGPGKANQ